jgi:hypothetical protein
MTFIISFTLCKRNLRYHYANWAVRPVHRSGGPNGEASLFATVNPFIEQAQKPIYPVVNQQMGCLSLSETSGRCSQRRPLFF